MLAVKVEEGVGVLYPPFTAFECDLMLHSPPDIADKPEKIKHTKLRLQ
jgi:hypothetical protein